MGYTTDDKPRKALKELKPSKYEEINKDDADIQNRIMFFQDEIMEKQTQFTQNISEKEMSQKVKTIFGFKMFMLDESTLCLKSIYAFTDDDVFCFKLGDNNTITLLKTPYLM